MARWQRRARIVLAIVVIAVPIAVALAVHRRATPPAGASQPASVPPNAVVSSTKGELTQINGSSPDYGIKYQEQSTYADGSTHFIGVTITVKHRGGRDFIVTGDDAQVGNGHSEITLRGHARVQVSDGLRLETDHLIYTQNDGMVRAGDEPVTFTRNGLHGRSVGMTYDQHNDILSLIKDVVIHIAPDAQGQNGADLTAGSAEFVRRQHMLIFQDAVHLARGGEVVDADAGTAYLTEDEKYLSMLDLRGSSRITGAAAAQGGLRAMHARDIDLQYRPDGGTIQQATLNGSAQLVMAGASVRQDRRIDADDLTLEIGPDGSTVTRLTGRGHVALAFPAQQDTPARTIHADSMGANGDGNSGGIDAALLSGHVEYRERLKGGDRIARAGALELALAPGLGDVHTATFTGAVRITQADMQAQASSARYDVAAGTMALSGTTADSPPHVVDDRIIVDATAIALTPDGPSLKATGNVRSVLKPASQTTSATTAGQPPTRVPAILKADQPVNVTSASLVYDGPAAHAVYTGQARLWQGETAVQSDELVLDDRNGNLTATGNVRTSMLVVDKDTKKKTSQRSPVIAQAQNLQYDDDARRATYTTSAHLNGPDGDLTGDRIELYLSPAGDEVQRLEGYDHVTLKQQGRVVTGGRLSYFEADEHYLVTGAPVKINEECRETLGKSLTFYKSTDRIIVDSGGGTRTETTGGSNCTGPRPQ
jgi:lipopolysaccharide export system protein LptA